MRQTRITDYLVCPPKPPPSGLTFLNLPYEARRLVYEYAGLIRQDVVDLNLQHAKVHNHRYVLERDIFNRVSPDGRFYETLKCSHEIDSLYEEEVAPEDEADDDEDEEYVWAVNDFYRCEDCDWFPHPLLLVSKAISKEVTSILYGENSFRARSGGPEDAFQRLLSMPPDGLTAMTSLSIWLGHANWAWFPEEHLLWEADEEGMSQEWGEIRAGSIYNEHVDNWKKAVNTLAKHISPNRLSLYLKLETKDYETAQELLESILQLPGLKNCAIQFSEAHDDQRNTALQDLAKQTISRMMKWKETSSSFPYIDLPPELRLRILECSDLVSPEDIQWQPNEIRYLQPCRHCIDVYIQLFGGECSDEIEGFPCSLISVPYRDAYCAIVPDCCSNCCTESWDNCFCAVRSPAAFSSTCTCIPRFHPLFLVSRQVREEAMHVYYSRNRFVVVPRSTSEVLKKGEASYLSWYDARSRRVELSAFLTLLPPTAVQHIRWLEWILPRFDSDYLPQKHHAWHDYLDMLDFMDNGMNLARLTLIINMSHGWFDPVYATNEQVQYKRVIAPLRRLKELKDCFVYLGRPFQPSQRQLEEQKLEKLVMGSHYDSSKRGKSDERRGDTYVPGWSSH